MNSPLSAENSEISATAVTKVPAVFYVVVTLALALVMTLGRAYDTQNMGVLIRSTLWITVCGLTVSQVLLFGTVFEKMFVDLKFNKIISGVLAISVTVILMTIELALLKFTPLLPKKQAPFFEFLLFVASPVIVVGWGVLVTKSLLEKRISELSQLISGASEKSYAIPEVKLDEHNWSTGRVKWVHAQEHYLQIVVDNETFFFRGRMRDALEQLATHDGMQVHRSWWVASCEIEKVIRRGRDYQVRLKSGDTLPVARSKVPLLKERRWLK